MAFRRLRRALIGLVAAFFLVLVGGQVASAHVSVSGNATQGDFGAFAFSVPNERDDASTTKLEVQMPEDVNLVFASAQAKPGWEVAVTKRTLDKPVEMEGEQVTEVVDTITWSGGEIGPGEYDTFGVSGGPFPDGVDSIEFKAIQTYSDGEEVSWIEPTPASGEEPEHPAPVLTVNPPEEGDEGATTTTEAKSDESASGTTASDSSEDDDSSTGLAIAGLVVGLIALAAAGFAIVSSRKPSSGT